MTRSSQNAAGNRQWWTLGGTYDNAKPRVEALETLIRKLPDLTTPAPPPVNRPKPGRARQLDADQVQELIAGYQDEQPCTNWGRNSASNGERSATSFTDTTCSCEPPRVWYRP